MDIITDLEKLKIKCEPVRRFDRVLKSIINKMSDIMYSNNGIGISAPQIEIYENIIVVDIGKGFIPMINPIITKSSGEQIRKEGCLSFPNTFVDIKRYDSITVFYRNVNGKQMSLTASGLVSAIIQHEIDHLKGITILDRKIQDDEQEA